MQAALSAPPQSGRDLGQNRFDHMCVVGNPQLVGYGQQQRVGLGDSFVFSELLDEYLRLGGIASAEDRPGPLVDETDLVIIFPPVPEIATIAIIHQREDAAADRDPRLASMARLLPGGAVGPDLGSLLQVESLACFVVLECRALQIHPEFCCPDRRGVRAGAPPYPVAQAIRMGFQTQQPRRIWKHRSWIEWGEAITAQQVEKDLRMTPSHVCVILA